MARALALIVRKFHEVVTGICLPAECEIGPGLYIGHFGPVIVHPRARLGANCNLSQGVTLGAKQSGAKAGAPTLGDRVYVGPNAVVIGAIQIGNDVAIGAGAVVLEDVPDRGVVVGNPGRLVNRQGSFDLVRYDSMDRDPERIASLALVVPD
jgi:serine O-acetyltransferase